MILLAFACLVGGYILYRLWKPGPKCDLGFIDRYSFPTSIEKKIKKDYPGLDQSSMKLVMDGLREYLCICGMANLKMVSMPSKIVDAAWHEFILNTLEYDAFCKSAFGKYLHHTPADAEGNGIRSTDGIKRTWRISCRLHGIDYKNPSKLPPLFWIDKGLNVPDGIFYDLKPKSELKSEDMPIYYASEIGCFSSCSSGQSLVDSLFDFASEHFGGHGSHDHGGHGHDSGSHGDSGHSCGGHSCGGHSCGGGH